MKKIFLGMSLGLIMGLLLAFTASVYADDIKTEVKSLIGYQVQGTFPVKLQDSQLETDAIVVDNTSYLPARMIAELFNSNVSFIDNTVIVTAKDGTINPDKLKEYEKVATDKQLQWEKDKAANDKKDQELKDKIKAEADAAEAEKQKIKQRQDEDIRKAQEAAQQQQQAATSTPNP